MDNKQKCLCMVAILLALMAYSTASSITTSTNTSIINQTVGLNIIVNNTNLGPNTVEHPGTGERIQGTTYFNNNSDIEIFVWGHAQNISQTAELHLFINGTKVSDTSGRALGAAEQSNKTIVAIIPRYSSYKIEAVNAHHYEWREYQILSGNFTSNISTCSGCINQTQLNEKVNITTNGTTVIESVNATGWFSHIILTPTLLNIKSGDGFFGEIAMNQQLINFGFNAANTLLLSETLITAYVNLDMNGNNITNCGNCVTSTSRLINETIISSATNIINFTVPVNDKGYEMYIYINNSNSSTADLSMFINNDTTETNYTSQVLTINGATVSSARSNTAHIMAESALAEGFSTIKIQKTNLNTLVIHSDGSRFIGSTSILLEKATVTKVSKISNITTITLSGSLLNSIGVGSEFRIYKVD